MIKITDAGRSKFYDKEKNDCSVRAFALAFDVPYAYAYGWMRDNGRSPSRAFSLPALLGDISKSKKPIKGKRIIATFYNKKSSRLSVEAFINVHKTGRYICHIKGHVFAIIDGIVHDDSPFDLKECEILSTFKII